MNLLNAFASSGEVTGVGFVAHVGGFIAGLVLLPILRVNEELDYDPWQHWRRADDESLWAGRR